MNKTGLIAIIVVVVVVVAGLGVYFGVFYHPSPSKLTLTVWGSGSAGGESNTFNASLAQFEKMYPNVTISDSPAINVASTTFLSAAKAGTAPDVYRDTSDNAAVLFDTGLVLNLTPILNSTYVNSFTKGTIADWTTNGALFGVPVNTNGIGLYMNLSLLPKSANGTPIPPGNIYQMIQDAKNVSDKGSGYLGLPYAVGADSGYRYAAFMGMYNATPFVEVNSTTYLPTMNSTANIAAMNFLWNLTKNGVDSTSLVTSDGITPEMDYFESGHSVFMLDGPWDQATYAAKLGSNLSVEAIPYNNATHTWPLPYWGSVGWIVSTPAASGINSAQQWIALKFVEFMTDESAQVQYFKTAGDFPSLISAGNAITSNASLKATDPLIDGWLQQEEHVQVQPSFEQMNYYWSNFHIGASNLWANSSKLGSNPVVSAMNQIQVGIISSLKAAGLPSVSVAVVSDKATQTNVFQQYFYVTDNWVTPKLF